MRGGTRGKGVVGGAVDSCMRVLCGSIFRGEICFVYVVAVRCLFMSCGCPMVGLLSAEGGD